jgi:N-acetylneuraminate synthase
MNSINFIAEIGINHNGNIDYCKKLILLSKLAGANFVKIQKRNPDVCVPENQKNKLKNTPWGEMTYLEYKYKIEFDETQIIQLFEYSKTLNIELFASVWDIDSAKLMAKYTRYVKIGSAMITDLELLKITRELFDYVIISTGMSTEEEISQAVSISKPDVIMHTNSTYPSNIEELNLNYITHLKNKYPQTDIGYSSHELEQCTLYTAIGLGSTWIEKHITLNRNLWGSDQKASIEPHELFEIIKNIQHIKLATQYPPQNRILFESENSKKNSLRK